MENLTKEEIKQRIMDELKDGIDVYADYRDQLEAGSIKELQKRLDERGAESAKNIFMDYITEIYEDYDLYNGTEDMECVCQNQGIDYDELDDDMKDYVNEVFNENVFYNLPYDHYLGQDVCINIVVDAGDANYDFGINEVYPHYDGDYDELKSHGVPNKSCIAWLAKRQGYYKKELKKALLHDDKVESKFLQSMYEELLNCSSALPQLVFMKKMTIEEWLEQLEKKTISITKDTRTGLVDFWNGAGGLLDIELEKDFTFSSKFIHEIQPDVCYRYGVLDIYGAPESLYD